MMLNNEYQRLCFYQDQGYIVVTDDDPPELSFDPALWPRLGEDVYADIETMADYYLLVHDYIFTHPDGTQMTEDEATITLMEAAVGKQSVATLYHLALERYFTSKYEDRLIADSIQALQEARDHYD